MSPRPKSRRESAGGRCGKVLFALACLLSLPLRAHDIYSSFAEAKLLPDRLEISLTLARASARDLLADTSAPAAITPENFSRFRPLLLAEAARLFELSTAGRPLGLNAAEVTIKGDADIGFALRFPRPGAGTLQVAATLLRFLVDGHTLVFVLADVAGHDLGWAPLSIDQPVFRCALPSATNPSGPSSATSP